MESIVNLAVGKIGQLLLNEFNILTGVKSQVEGIKDELKMMQSFLTDMDALDDDESSDARTRTTAERIRRIAYEAEDVIDTYILEANPAEFKKISSFKNYLSCFRCVTDHQVGTEIQDIRTKIDATMEMLKKYRGDRGMPMDVVRPRAKQKAVWRPASYPHIQDDYVVGIDEDITKLVSLLTDDERQIKVLSIAGMGGCGKTTIVRKVYNHPTVRQHFEGKEWVVISKQWVAQTGLVNMLVKISGEAVKLRDDNIDVGVKISEFLKERKYLIVLDDVWTKKDLEEILTTTQIRNSGSKLIVTTRFREIIDNSDENMTHEPKSLTDDESWELFDKIVSLNSANPEYEELKALGEEMLEKCKGLPLAVVALAGLVAKKKTVEDWKSIKESVSSRVMEEGEGRNSYGPVGNMLTLSYNDLSRDLKPLFLYLGVFPEDYWIRVGRLIKMWIAEGFISNMTLYKGETQEDLARKCIDELIGRCMVRVSERHYDGKAKFIEVHDLMRDLSIKKAKELDFLRRLSGDSSKSIGTTLAQTRRLVVDLESKDTAEFCPISIKNPHIRSLLLFENSTNTEIKQVELKLLPILKSFNLLRVLKLDGIRTPNGTLPEDIGSLILLTYLSIRFTNVMELPSSMRKLHNLLTLDYRNIQDEEDGAIFKIPDVFWEIEGIRHIYISGRRVHTCMRLDTLKHLQNLWIGAGSWVLDQMRILTTTIQKLHLESIYSQEELDAVLQSPTIKSKCLRNLYLSWCNNYDLDLDTDTDSDVDEDEDDEEDEDGNEDEDDEEDEDGNEDEDDEEGEDGNEDDEEGEDGNEDDEDVDGNEDEDKVGDGGIVLRDLHLMDSPYLRKVELSGRIDDKTCSIQFPLQVKKVVLEFTKLEAEATLHMLGKLPNLQVLYLGADSYLGSKWTSYDGTFSQLKVLEIRKLPNLEEWTIERGAMCQLKELTIYNCQRLRRLPQGLKDMTSIEEISFRHMPEEFEDRVDEDDGEDYHIIQHIPAIFF